MRSTASFIALSLCGVCARSAQGDTRVGSWCVESGPHTHSGGAERTRVRIGAGASSVHGQTECVKACDAAE